jgi:[acyl-carrier-protein] S-malonyltransferase
MKSFAFVFPGQGSQSVGMLDAWGDHPVVGETLARKPLTRWAKMSPA